MKSTFVPNDVYATQQSRFQIITGCNMSGRHLTHVIHSVLKGDRKKHVYPVNCPNVHYGSDRKLVRSSCSDRADPQANL
jgi:hypothetical protein